MSRIITNIHISITFGLFSSIMPRLRYTANYRQKSARSSNFAWTEAVRYSWSTYVLLQNSRDWYFLDPSYQMVLRSCGLLDQMAPACPGFSCAAVTETYGLSFVVHQNQLTSFWLLTSKKSISRLPIHEMSLLVKPIKASYPELVGFSKSANVKLTKPTTSSAQATHLVAPPQP